MQPSSLRFLLSPPEKARLRRGAAEFYLPGVLKKPVNGIYSGLTGMVKPNGSGRRLASATDFGDCRRKSGRRFSARASRSLPRGITGTRPRRRSPPKPAFQRGFCSIPFTTKCRLLRQSPCLMDFVVRAFYSQREAVSEDISRQAGLCVGPDDTMEQYRRWASYCRKIAYRKEYLK